MRTYKKEMHKSLQRQIYCKKVPFFDGESEDLIKSFCKSCDDKIFYPYSFPEDYSFEDPSEIELVSCAMHYDFEKICPEEYFPSQQLLERFVADKDHEYGDNYFMCQPDREQIAKTLINQALEDKRDNIPTTHADFLFHFPSELEARIPEYQDKIANALTLMFPDKQIRVAATTWTAEDPNCSAGFYLSHVYYNVRKIGDYEKQQIFLPPTKNIIGHGTKVYESLEFDDEKANELITEIINEFSEAALYNNSFTSADLIKFVYGSCENVGMAEVHAYTPEEALTEALEIISDEYPEIFEIPDYSYRFIIYIGSNFENKENLILTAKKTIKKYLKLDDELNEFEVAIAHSDDLTGAGDLVLYALS